jgi:hypothetical protein
VAILIYAQVKSGPVSAVVPLSKRVWVRIDRYNPQLTLRDVYEKIREIQRENPELDVFFDGDEFAICSRPKPDSETQVSEETE